MAKDGTQRGGMRMGAGKKPDPLNERNFSSHIHELEFDVNADYNAPPPKEYLTTEQKGGGKLCSEQIYRETYKWLKSVGCEKLVAKQLIENYSLTMARHIQCEGILSKFGLLAKHPTTREPTTSPFVKMSIDYMKQASQLWYQIYAVVKEHNAKGQVTLTAQSETMDRLLRRVK